MVLLSTDTEEIVEHWQIAQLRAMSLQRKAQLLGAMYHTVHTLAQAGLRQRYPTDTPAQHRRRLADLLLGPELATWVYGPLQEESLC